LFVRLTDIWPGNVPGALRTSAPLDVSQVFRLSTRYEEKNCTLFDGPFPAGGPGCVRAVPADRDRHARDRRTPAKHRWCSASLTSPRPAGREHLSHRDAMEITHP
jgi:hypothetical protein